jgi:septum formation protein
VYATPWQPGRVSTRTLVLASASPARLALLRAAGFAPRVEVSGDSEDGVDGLNARRAACALAERKAEAVASRLAAEAGDSPTALVAGDSAPLVVGCDSAPLVVGCDSAPLVVGCDSAPLVVGCDSVLLFDGEVRGKPASAGQAGEWWRGYRGREGTLVSGHAVIDLATGRRASRPAETIVRFGRPSDAEIDAYVATGEPLAVAGGFTLDGYCAPFVDGIDGDHGTVLGLSLPLLRALLADLDIDITALWAPA